MNKGYSDQQLAKVLQFDDSLITVNNDVYHVISKDNCEKSGKQCNNLDALKKSSIILRKGDNFATKNEQGMWVLNG